MSNQLLAIVLMGFMGICVVVVGGILEDWGYNPYTKRFGIVLLIIPTLTLFKIAILG